MSTRLYEEFMKKLKVPPVRRFVKRGNKESGAAAGASEDLVITIPLKGGQGVRVTFRE